uniref:Importin subunit alpha n=1 Tax=Salarias fasciatus TaxID=181472 RepID=A0A672FAK0_SALFA
MACTEARLSRFKNKFRDPAKLREKRIAMCVKLRKDQKNEHIMKRRKITLSSLPDEEISCASIEDIVRDVNSDCILLQIRGCQAARKLLSVERDSSINEIIIAGLLSRFVAFLSMEDEPTLQFEAAWALTNVTSGTSWHTKQVVDHGAVPAFIALLSSPMLHISEQAVWAIGNIAGDGPVYRDVLIACNAVPALLACISPDTPLGFLHNLAWTLSNLCRSKDPYLPGSVVQQMLPSLIMFLHLSDKNILSEACWAFSYLSDGENDRIEVVVRTGIIPRLIELLNHEDTYCTLSIVAPALRTVGNIVSGSDAQTQVVIDAGFLEVLPKLLRHSKSSVQKEAAWALSNIAAGPSKQIQQLINCGLFAPLVELLRSGDFKSQREAVWAVMNITIGGTVDQMIFLVRTGALEAIVHLLQVRDAKVVMVILDTINNLAAEKSGETEGLCRLIEELGGFAHIEMLQNHENVSVCKAASHLLDKCTEVSLISLRPLTNPNYIFLVASEHNSSFQTLNSDL